MRKTNEGRSLAGILFPAAGAGLAATLLMLLVGALLVRRGTLNEAFMRSYAVLSLAFGCALSAFIASVCAPGRKLLWAAGAGMMVFLFLLLGAVFASEDPISILKTVLSFLCALAASAIGGFAGAAKRKKRKY